MTMCCARSVLRCVAIEFLLAHKAGKQKLSLLVLIQVCKCELLLLLVVPKIHAVNAFQVEYCSNKNASRSKGCHQKIIGVT